ncbi:hypothetical protein [Lutibacter sp.]|uniref:hypothetical protein n=1 Tax=Lutibacter sp. TaxID=1925666 RepID=UPI0025C3954D|nr:hypothetical protein [Lutibacter sp.]MCF6180769.1 hypothetical protein [Lutibacter sp.]
MKNKTTETRKISRRGILPIIGGAFLLPLLGFSNPISKEMSISNEDNEEFETLLKPDGTAVKVRVSALKKAKVVTKNVSNKSFLNWLGKKL